MRTPEETKLRDEFAGIALAHIMRLHKFDIALDDDLNNKWLVNDRRRLAVHSYKMADAMLEVRTQDLSKIQE